jgi:hypothetical protein
MYEDGARWYASLLEMDGARLEAVGLAGLVPATVEDAAVAYLVSALAVDPPVTPREACVMVAECGDLARFLMSRIEQASKTVDAVRLARLVEDAKKNSPGTRESGDGSS